MPTLGETPQTKREIEENTSKHVEKARKKWEKIKGKFYKVEDYIPHTEIFVREGKNPKIVIENFKEKQRYFKRIYTQ